MKHSEKLENFWQFRLAKIIWIIAMIGIWIYGTLGIWVYFSYNPYKSFLSQPKNSLVWEIYDFDDFVEHRHRKMAYAENYGAMAEKSAQFEFWKYPKMILAFFILTGSLVLATMLAYRVVIYIAFGRKNCEKCPSKSDENSENTEQNSEKTEEIVEAEIVNEKSEK